MSDSTRAGSEREKKKKRIKGGGRWWSVVVGGGRWWVCFAHFIFRRALYTLEERKIYSSSSPLYEEY